MNWISIGALGAMIAVASLLILRPSWGIVALVLFYPFNNLVPRAPVPGLNSETILLSVAVLSTLLRKGTLLPPLRLSGPILAYFVLILVGWAITASWYTNDYWQVTNLDNFMMAKSLVFPTLAFFLAYFWATGEEVRRRLLEALAYALLVVATGAILDWFLGSKAGSDVGTRATGLFENPNALGVFLGMFSVVPLYLLRGRTLKGRRRALLVATYVLTIVALILTLSRKAWLSVLLVHAVWLLYVNRSGFVVFAVATALAATLAYPLLPSLIRDRIEQTFQPGQVLYQRAPASEFDSSTAQRVVLYQVGFRMFADSPIWGQGFNSVLLLTPRYGARYGLVRHRNPHSIPLKVMAENGLIGLAALGWMLAVLVRIGRTLWRRGESERELGPAFLAACAGLGLASLAGTMIEDHQLSLYFWLFFGLVARAEVEHMDANQVALPA